MRILIDECIDERLRNYLRGHDCRTARYAGLSGLKNADLFTAAEAANLDVFLTADQGIEYQQNLAGRRRRDYHLPHEIESSEGALAVRAHLSYTRCIHSAGSDRQNRRPGQA